MSDIHAPLPRFDEALLQKLGAELDAGQQLWLSGYLYGLSVGRPAPAPAPALSADRLAAAPAVPVLEKSKLTVLYGSQTGNSKSVAAKAAESARALGFEVALIDMNDYAPQQLRTERRLLIVVSTHGEGEPPAAAETLHQLLHSARAPQLPELRFAVLALGDRAYAQFCQTGRDFDEKLAQLGANRIAPRVDCDVDFQEDAEGWVTTVLEKLASPPDSRASPPGPLSKGEGESARLVFSENKADVSPSPLERGPGGEARKEGEAFTRKNPFPAAILEKIQLHGRGAAKETWHVELSLEGSGLHFEPGDSLGIVPQNPEELVREVLRASILPAAERVDWQGEKTTLSDVLTRHAELTLVTRDALERLHARSRYPKLAALLADPAALREYAWGRDLADVLRDFPDVWSAEALLKVLRPLQPRLYSIASSPLFAEGEAHLTVSAVRYEAFGRKKRGVGSTLLTDGLNVGQNARVFIERNEYFKLPADTAAPILMIGPGTGVAPFRAFVQERATSGATGKSWLFFGNPHFETDFLYQTEWQKALKTGALTRLDVAFSRDQADKIYVQHKLLQHGRDVFQWLESGAHVFVCGDKNRMAADVRTAFQEIIQQHGGQTAEQAEAYFKDLKKQRRYLEDVY